MSIIESATRARVSVIRVSGFASAADRWRVTREDGDVLGYVDRSADVAGHPFHAWRFMARARQYVPVGDFWSMDDALEALR